MKSKVYFIRVSDGESIAAVAVKLGRLLDVSGVLNFVRRDDRVAVKVHFGEEGNTGFVDPAYVRVVCDRLLHQGAEAFLADTNTLYRGKRTNSKDHLELALAHGFTRQATGVPVLIPDDTKKEDTVDVPVGQKHIRTAKLARLFVEADAIVAVTHFKGHMITGFGGALKNLAMGCAMREGKLMQHCDLSPEFYAERCTGCGECKRVCPVGAIEIENGKSVLDKVKCIGCANCVGVCPTAAMFFDLEAGGKVQAKMVEYAAAVLQGKKGRMGYLNFAVKINRECDCWGEHNPRIASDVGILASLDPVSIDKASRDLVNADCGKDIFKETHPRQDSDVQLTYAQELGLGSVEYELIIVR